MRCRITYVNPLDRKLTLSVEDSQEEQIKPLEVGEICELEVTGETPGHYTVVPFDHDGIVDGILPKSHLPDQVSYSVGQSLKASLYCKVGSVHRFSNNPAIRNIFTNEDMLETSDSVTCCVEKFDLNSKWVDLYSLHPYRVFKCRRKNILANGNLSTHQIIQVPKNIMHNYNKHDEGSAEVQQNDDKVTTKAKKSNNKKKVASNLEVNSQQEERLSQVSSKTPRLSKRPKRHSESLLKNPDNKNFHTKKRKEA